MKKHLLIALENSNSLLMAAKTAQHIIKKYPRDTIELLTFESLKKVAQTINGIQQIHTIDCQKINQTIDGQYYSDMHALNTFISPLSPLLEVSWEQVINCDASKVSASLTSVFVTKDQCKFVGSRMGRKGNRISADLWSMIGSTLRDIMNCQYISSTDILHQSFRTTPSEECNYINLNEDLTSRAFQMLQKIRSANPSNCRLIGVPLFNAHQDNTFTFERVIETIGSILDDAELFPIILTSTNDRDRVFARQVSKEFANSLLMLEVDSKSLPASLVNLDAIIGGTSHALALADILGTPLLRICSDTSSMLNLSPSSNNQLSIITSQSTASATIASDIHTSIKHLLGDSPALDSISLSSALYTFKKDDFGTYAYQVAGRDQQQFNLQYHMMRSFISLYSNRPIAIEKSIDFANVELNVLTSWAQTERNAITLASRDLLGTLRSLLRTQKDRRFIGEFIQSLDKLFKHGDEKNIASLCCNFFRARIDGIEEANYEANIQLMEKALYQLKDDLQAAIGMIKNIEDFAQEQSKQTRVQAIHQRLRPTL